jgi:hypothetical protein
MPREVAAGLVVGAVAQPHGLEHLVYAPVAVPAQRCEHAKVAPPAERRVDHRGLDKRTDVLHVSGEAVARHAEDLDPPAGRADQSEEHPDRGRLPGAVGPDEAGDDSLGHGERQPVDGEPVAVPLGQVGRTDGGRAARDRRRGRRCR